MTFLEFASAARRRVLADLESGEEPGAGEFDRERLRAARAHGEPRMGSMVVHPERLDLEFPFVSAEGAVVFSVSVATPERVVAMPVPEWVVENVWHGTVEGSFVFESEARAMLGRLAALLEPGPNRALFAGRASVGRS